MDVSSIAGRASAPATDPLRYGFFRVRRVEHCACGIEVIQFTGMTILETVREHNRTPEHQAWRARLILRVYAQ